MAKLDGYSANVGALWIGRYNPETGEVSDLQPLPKDASFKLGDIPPDDAGIVYHLPKVISFTIIHIENPHNPLTWGYAWKRKGSRF